MAAAHLGLWKATLEQVMPRIAEKPFDATRKRMTTVHTVPPVTPPMLEALERVVSEFLSLGDAACIAFTKGSVGSLLEVSTQVWVNGRTEAIGEHWRQKIIENNDQLARNGMRVLGIAFHPLASQSVDLDNETLEQQQFQIQKSKRNWRSEGWGSHKA